MSPHRGVRWFVLAALLLAGASLALAQKPDFKLFSIQPKYLTNHTTTTVHWKGTHFAGVHLTFRGPCKVLSYTSTETEIVMQIQAERPPDEQYGYCNLYLRNRFGSNDSWVMVNFTDADQKQVHAAKQARDLQQIKDEMARAGKEWTIHLPGGATRVFRAEPPNNFGVVHFKDSEGMEITIMVLATGETVLQFPNGCNRLGRLHDGRVMNGISNADCVPAGAWSAEMK